jgi:hypothetical protein
VFAYLGVGLVYYRFVSLDLPTNQPHKHKQKQNTHSQLHTKSQTGKDLVSIRNSVTKTTTACFEPSLDYCVVKARHIPPCLPL